MKYQLVIFDSDGTLANTLPWMSEVFNDLAETLHFRKVDSADSERLRELHGPALLKALGLPLWKLPQVLIGMRRRMADHPEKLQLFPGIDEVLHRLASSGIPLAIVSSNSRPNVERVLGPKNAALISHYACGASMFGKSAKIRAVVRTVAVPPAQAIYVGDEIRDGEAARKAGVAFGAVAWGMHRIEMLLTQNPAEVFHRVPEMAEKLGNI